MLWAAVGILLAGSTMPLPEPPSWDGAIHADGTASMGCDIEQIKDFSGRHWFVYVYINFLDHQWTPTTAVANGRAQRIPYAIRNGDDAGNLEAMKDCHYWLRTVTKRERERLKREHK